MRPHSSRCPFDSRSWLSPLLAATASLVVCGLATASLTGSPPRAQREACREAIELSLASGTVLVELFADAAPEVIDRLDALADFETSLETVVPNAQVTTAPLAALSGLEITIDAESLGLDRMKVESVGEAMEVLQSEILPVHVANKQTPPTARLAEWIELWRASREADFLVGVSRQEIYEALGFRYQSGLRSRPVVRGAVVLEPATPHLAADRMTFVLQDRPSQTGRFWVFGQVVEGLELLVQASRGELEPPQSKRGPLAEALTVRVAKRCLDPQPEPASTATSSTSRPLPISTPEAGPHVP